MFTILLAEDRLSYLEDLKNTAKKLGFTVKTAEDGQAAINQLEKNNFHVVFTDYQMPLANGMQVAEKALQKNTPIIAINTAANRSKIPNPHKINIFSKMDMFDFEDFLKNALIELSTN